MRAMCLTCLIALSAWCAAPPPPAAPGKWVPDDLVHFESASSWQFSPDGRFVVWSKSAPNKDKNEHVGHLFRTDLATLRQVQLTRGPDGCSSPRWSPDGKLIAFLSSRPVPKVKAKSRDDDEADDDDAKSQLWLLDPTGGEPWPLTDGKRGVQKFAWAGSEALVFTAPEAPTRRETVLKEEKKDDAIVVEDDANEPPIRLFKVEVDGKKVTRLTSDRDRIEQLAVSPDGRFALTSHARSLRYVYDNKVKPVWYLRDLEKGTATKVFADARLNLIHAVWSPDGAAVYAIDRTSSKPHLDQAGLLEVVRLDAKTGRHERVDLGWPRGLGDGSSVVPLRDGFLTLLADGVRHRPARYTFANGKFTRAELTGEHARNLFDLAATPDGSTVIYSHSTASQPPRWYVSRPVKGVLAQPKVIAKLNDHLERRIKARTAVIHWKGGDGDTVEGVLYYPHDYRPGQKAPLVVQIHGGPAGADYDSWDDSWAYPTNLLCQRGAFVLKPNYHGSMGYGRQWLESIADGRYCEPEIEDIEKGVDALIARGLVDPKRLGLQGWSNGGILTNVLITRTTRYRAAVSGAGTVEYVSDWASCEFGEAFDRFYLGRSPLEDHALYVRKSPFHRLGAVTTPTLILFGTEDRVVHPQQGWALYRGLQQLGKAPVRFVQYPGEKHGLKKLSAQRRNIEEALAWFDRHLFGTARPPQDALKKSSPLAWALGRRKASKVGPRYGTLVKGTLAPETVLLDGVNVGRFEVTRAQFAAYDAARRPEPGQENHPVGDVTFAQAKAYCAWLSRRTGRRYRLPTTAEAEKLYEGSRDGENTLDAWAGYAVNPEDAGALRETLRELGDGALLKEVGQGRGRGDSDLVYDLGGNVAEWIDDDGKGLLKGGSADSPADEKSEGTSAAAAYRGLRVVLD